MRQQVVSDLNFIISGASQHVFSRATDPAHVWKLPATMNTLLPTPAALHSFTPTVPWKARLWAYTLPLLPPLAARGVERLLVLHLRRRRTTRFEAMLEILERLQNAGADAYFLPYRVSRAQRISAATPAGLLSYRGPVLVQRRADIFHRGSFDSTFDWQPVVEIQQALWRYGVGLDDAAAVLGPHDWAVLGGRVCLGDTGSLTADRQAVHRTLEPATLDGATARLLRACRDPTERSAASRYSERVRATLTQQELARVWAP